MGGFSCVYVKDYHSTLSEECITMNKWTTQTQTTQSRLREWEQPTKVSHLGPYCFKVKQKQSDTCEYDLLWERNLRFNCLAKAVTLVLLIHFSLHVFATGSRGVPYPDQPVAPRSPVAETFGMLGTKKRENQNISCSGVFHNPTTPGWVGGAFKSFIYF